MRLRNGALATGAVATLAAFGLLASVAGAQNTPSTEAPTGDTSPHPVRIAGNVEKVDDPPSTLTLTTAQGSVSVNISDQTWVLAEKDGKCAEGSLSDIKTGQRAVVGGMSTRSASLVNARTVAQGRCAAGAVGLKKLVGRGILGIAAQHLAQGVIKSVSGSAIVIKSERGDDVTISITADTVVLNSGFTNVATLKVGDKIQVLGKPTGATDKPVRRSRPGQRPANPPAPRTLDAWGLRVITDASKLVVGRVEKIEGNTITLKAGPDGDSARVTLDAGTAYKAANANVMDRKITLTNAAQSDIKVGGVILVEGAAPTGDASITADAVVIMPGILGKVLKP